MIDNNILASQQYMNSSVTKTIPSLCMRDDSRTDLFIFDFIFSDISGTASADSDKPARSAFTDRISLLYLCCDFTLSSRL